MTIQITKPEVEAIINQRLETGAFKDAEDVVFQALQCSSSLDRVSTTAEAASAEAKNMFDLFAPLRGLDIDFEADRANDTGRDIGL